MPAQHTQFYLPVVMLVPTMNVSFLWKARMRRPRHSMPSGVPGKYAVRLVPEYGVPFGCVPDLKLYRMTMTKGHMLRSLKPASCMPKSCDQVIVPGGISPVRTPYDDWQIMHL